MLTANLQPAYLSEQVSSEIASRQILSFLQPPDAEAYDAGRRAETGPAPGKSLFLLDALPKGALGEEYPFFNWTSRDIYDVDDRLLFRDQMIDLGDGNVWRVRTAASDLLRTPVWSVYAGPCDVEARMEKALTELRGDLEPVIVDGEKKPKLVCYGYPKLGILARSRTDPAAKFVMDIGEFSLLPLDSFEPQENPESVTLIWSPYDVAVRSTIALFRWLWKRNMRLLPALPETLEGLPKAIRDARNSILEKETNPQLILVGQQTNKLCAAATAKMILQQHGINETQDELAVAMHTGTNGATPDAQVDAINQLFNGTLRACLDTTPSFKEAQDEILANRPFKIGEPSHARAVGGFMIEKTGKNWLHIYDPDPPNKGQSYCEVWDVQLHHDFMYVQPVNNTINPKCVGPLLDVTDL
jgi:hypothetical protein